MCLYVQGVLMIAVAFFAFIQPHKFIAGTDDTIEIIPAQLMNSLRSLMSLELQKGTLTLALAVC